MADVSISRPDLKGLLSLEKRVLAQRVLDLHDELVRERARREEVELRMHQADRRVAGFDARDAIARGRTRDADLPATGSFHG